MPRYARAHWAATLVGWEGKILLIVGEKRREEFNGITL